VGPQFGVCRGLCDNRYQFSDGAIVEDGRGIGAVRKVKADGETFTTNSRQITDGTSNTMVLGEKRINLTHLGKIQASDNEGYTCGWNQDTVRTTTLEPAADYTHDFNGNIDEQFGSSHPGGFNIGLLDGSGRQLSYDVDLDVFKSLGCKDDGRIVDGSDL
jgi:hypothetical protein